MTQPGPTHLRLSRLRVYPLKGAGGFDLVEARPDAFGIPGDRRWMLVRPDGHFISQRTHPGLALIRLAPSTAAAREGNGPSEDPGSLAFEARAPGMEPYLLKASGDSAPTARVTVQGDVVEGRRVEGGSDWFSRFLRAPCHLVFSPSGFHRPVDPDYGRGHRTSFTDGYPLLLTSQASLEDLNRRISPPASMLRFRPNLVVDGGAPWEEDTWRALEMGGVRVELVKPCARCSVTTVDPASGSRGREPLNTLLGFRGWGGRAYFGQNAVFSGTGSFRVGTGVRILEKGEARPPIC